MKAAAFAAAVAAVVALIVWILRTNDETARLREAATAARPLIAAIDLHRREHGQVPVELPELHPPDPGGRTYTALGQNGYELRKKLGWDPSLCYRYRDGRAEWIFDPGDGTPVRTVTP